MNRYLSTKILKSTEKYFQQLSYTEIQRIVNFVSININAKQKQWQLMKNYVNLDYLISKNILKASFKNHILDWNGVQSFVQDVQALQALGNKDALLAYLFNCKDFRNKKSIKKIPSLYQRKFYIMTQDLKQQDLIKRKEQLQCLLNIQKIIVTPYNFKHYKYSSTFEQLCKEYNIKIMPIKDFTLFQFCKYLYQQTKGNYLIHQFVLNDLSYFKTNKQNYRYTPRQIYMFCHTNTNSKRQQQQKQYFDIINNYVDINLFIKNYQKRKQADQFNSKSQDQSLNFSIKKYVHKKTYQHLLPIIQDQKSISPNILGKMLE